MHWLLSKLTAIVLSFLSIFGIFTPPHQEAQITFGSGGAGGIRQEINIIDTYLGALSGSFATSSAIVQFDGTKYTAPSAYFEVVASTSASIATQVFLRNATSSATVATIDIPAGTTAYTRLRSSEITAIASTTQEFVVTVASTTGATKGVLAARIVILDSGSPLSSTETQIEIGNHETFSTTATTTFSSPKYWYYNAAGWDGSPAFYAEATYEVLNGVASSTTYSAAGTYTGNHAVGGSASTSVELWGGGGAGDGTDANSAGAYDGGGGGGYAKSVLSATTSSHTLVVGAGGTGEATTALAPSGATSTWDTSVVLAAPGWGAQTNSKAGLGGAAASSTGQITFSGGRGGIFGIPGSGGGGEGSGSTANGGNASFATGGTGTDGGDGANGFNVESDGAAGTAPGGGGSGANIADATNHAGGSGAAGRAIITNYIATTTIALQEDNGNFGSWTDKTYIKTNNDVLGAGPQRARSVSFTPSDGKHYRIAIRKNDARTSVAIYNAKIIVTAPTATTSTTYYIDGSDASATDPDGVWTNDANAFDADFSTSASTNSTSGSESTKYIKAEGTNAPTSGGTISLVEFRFYGGTPGSLRTDLYTDGLAENLGESSLILIGPTYSATTTASTPSGGWTWGKVAALESKTFEAAAAAGSKTLGIIEVTVTYVPLYNPTKFEPQYLLANTTLAGGTGLQNFLTSFNTADWTTTNNYLHAVSAIDNSTSTIEIDDTSGPTQITGSSIASPDNYATSTGMCLTSNATLDSKATNNQGNIFGSSIIVQVGVASTASCPVAAAPATPRMIINGQMLLNGSALVY